MAGRAQPGGLVFSTMGAAVGTEFKVVWRVSSPDWAGATCKPVRPAAAVAISRTAPPCALQSCSDRASIWTPVEGLAASLHSCALCEPWCADAVLADEPHASAHSALDSGTAARTTSTTTLIRCFQPTIRVYPMRPLVGGIGSGLAQYS